MSTLIVEVCTVDNVRPHPNADKGDPCVYFPPDSVIPEALADRWGISKYCSPLKAVYEDREGASRDGMPEETGSPALPPALPAPHFSEAPTP